MDHLQSNCGACVAGVVLDHDKGIQRCDDCKVFDDDSHAAAVLFSVWVLADPKVRVKHMVKR